MRTLILLAGAMWTYAHPLRTRPPLHERIDHGWVVVVRASVQDQWECSCNNRNIDGHHLGAVSPPCSCSRSRVSKLSVAEGISVDSCAAPLL